MNQADLLRATMNILREALKRQRQGQMTQAEVNEILAAIQKIDRHMVAVHEHEVK